MSLNEELQASNEELEASKEELQSMNEELSTLNTQLQENLQRQRIIGNDLQNVLSSSDTATLFLDAEAAHPLLHPGNPAAVQYPTSRRGPSDRRFHPKFRRSRADARRRTHAHRAGSDQE